MLWPDEIRENKILLNVFLKFSVDFLMFVFWYFYNVLLKMDLVLAESVWNVMMFLIRKGQRWHFFSMKTAWGWNRTGQCEPPSPLFTGNTSCKGDTSADTSLHIKKKNLAKSDSASQLNHPFTNLSQWLQLFSAINVKSEWPLWKRSNLLSNLFVID